MASCNSPFVAGCFQEQEPSSPIAYNEGRLEVDRNRNEDLWLQLLRQHLHEKVEQLEESVSVFILTLLKAHPVCIP